MAKTKKSSWIKELVSFYNMKKKTQKNYKYKDAMVDLAKIRKKRKHVGGDGEDTTETPEPKSESDPEPKSESDPESKSDNTEVTAEPKADPPTGGRRRRRRKSRKSRKF